MARDEVMKYGEEFDMNWMSFEMMVYAEDDDSYYPVNEIHEGKKIMKLSGTEVRRRLATGEEIPEWFSCCRVHRTDCLLAWSVLAITRGT